MAEDGSFLVPLRPLAKEKDQKDNIADLQFRMYQQKGHFRGITEKELEEEMQATQNGEKQTQENSGDEESEEEPDDKKRLEDLGAKRRELIQLVEHANNEAMVALDFVSLLLSKDLPKPASSTMSATLKQAAPSGSMGYSKWQMPPLDDSERRRRDLVAKGARMQGLNRAAEALLQSATRLEKDVRRETKYWEDVLSVSQNGWSLRRMPRQASTLGVQVVSAEANEQFRRKGFIPLRTNDQGNLSLDSQFIQSPKAVRVRIFDRKKLVGSSALPTPVNTDEAPIEDLINCACNSLFEQELFHEMALESRILLSHKVKFLESEIIFPLPPRPKSSSDASRTMEIRVDLAECSFDTEPKTANTEDSLAQNIVLGLRALLCRAHRQRLRTRSELPKPLSGVKAPQQPEAIIRPLLAAFLHYANVVSVRTHFKRLVSALRKAGFSESVFSGDDNFADAFSSNPQDSEGKSIEDIVGPLTQVQVATFKLSLPSSIASKDPAPTNEGGLIIKISTNISSPTSVSEFSITLPKALSDITPAPPPGAAASNQWYAFDSFAPLAAYIDSLVAFDVAHRAISLPVWLPGDRTAPVLVRRGADAVLDADKVAVGVVAGEEARLVLRYRPANGKEGEERTWAWGEGVAEEKVLLDVLAKL